MLICPPKKSRTVTTTINKVTVQNNVYSCSTIINCILERRKKNHNFFMSYFYGAQHRVFMKNLKVTQ